MPYTTADFLNLNAGGSYLEFPQNADLDFGSKEFTIEFWLNFSGYPGTSNHLFSSTNSTSEIGFSIYYYTGDTSLYLSSSTESSGWQIDKAWSWVPTLLTWYHVHFIKTGDSTFTFYIDNVTLGNQTDDSPLPSGNQTNPFRIGQAPSGASDSICSIDEVRVYHKALSSDERIQNYNHGAEAHGKEKV